ncbi:MAG TPA: site-2 protease family protein [Thermoanaerobaculia bacterium]|nr:site-2 protease family protein [Thermoanaerobaculia bacterium]
MNGEPPIVPLPRLELLPPPQPVAYRPPPLPRPRWGLALVLLFLAFLSVMTFSPVLLMGIRTDVQIDDRLLDPRFPIETAVWVWHHPELLAVGAQISLILLGILFAHEMGHYLTCRRYGLASTVPYFLPVPFGLGTVGAFIRIQAPIRDKRELFDVGVAGPLAGFVALLPFLFYGVAHSHVSTFVEAAHPNAAEAGLLLPGWCLAIRLVAWLFHGRLGPGQTLNLHPVAFAAWFGLFTTGLNLLPLGQLDGGHVLYAAIGRRQWRLAWPLWGVLALTGLLWPGWWLWCGILLLLRPRHPPVVDESVPLDRPRLWIAALALLLFVLCFTPVPIRIVNLG